MQDQRRRYPYRPSDIRAASFYALRWLAGKNGGQLPRDWQGAWKLAIRCGLSCQHLRQASSRDGELVETGVGEWTIFYHTRLRDDQRVLVILHELVEWLCITESPELMLDLPGGGVYAYDGGDNPQDVRHQAARYAERMYLRMVKTNTVGVSPQSAL